MKQQNRRSFLQFLGHSSILAAGSSTILPLLSACNDPKKIVNDKKNEKPIFPIAGIQAQSSDKLVLSEGLSYQILIKWGDPISEKDKFGFNNDYLAYLPLDKTKPHEGLLWVNHEYPDPLFISNFPRKTDAKTKTKDQVDKEMYDVGGSILHIKKNDKGVWEVVKDDKYNRRLNGFTMIPFDWNEPVAGKKEAMGTLGNCAGGVTPWGTILTCEENYQDCYGETDHKNPAKPKHKDSEYGWEHHYKENLTEHYGWVVEVNIKTGEAKKLVSLGRCAHECAQVWRCEDGRLVVYTGDDKNDEHIYKFISAVPDSLTEGTLYVANTEKGEWLSLNYEEQPLLKQHFKSQTEVLIRVREAAKLLGATPLNRPEDIEFDPFTGNVLVTLTNNLPKGDFVGQIMKIEEDSADKTGLKFKADTFLAGGPELGFACPDNMVFDPKGNLWFTSDMSGSLMNREERYKPFGNNGLFVYNAAEDKVIQVASAPMDAEFTGPYFSPDGTSLFLSVQHPGETSKSLMKEEISSHWPDGGENIPRAAVVVISGKALDELMKFDLKK
jgi:secreted PhoX family phosphatase